MIMKCWKQVTVMLKSLTVKTLAINKPKPFGNVLLFCKINAEKSNICRDILLRLHTAPPPTPTPHPPHNPLY